MAILLLFNDSDTVTYEEIAEGTKLAKETLDPSISVFVKAKIVTVSPDNAKPEPGAVYKLNHGFKAKKLKMNLNIGIKSEAKQEVEDTHKTIEEDRKLLMQVSQNIPTLRLNCIPPTLLLWIPPNSSIVGYCTYHEIPQEDEAPAARFGNYPANQKPLLAKSAGY